MRPSPLPEGERGLVPSQIQPLSLWERVASFRPKSNPSLWERVASFRPKLNPSPSGRGWPKAG